MAMYHTSPIGDSGFTEKEELTFINQYIQTLLWSSITTDPETGDIIEGLECETSSQSMDAQCSSDCLDFLGSNYELLSKVMKDNPHYDISQAGHDFALTRNGHGAGFWDRGLGRNGDLLTEYSRAYGEVNCYIGDDGYVYLD